MKSYYDTLELKPNDVSGKVRAYLKNIRVVLLILVTIIVLGVSSFFIMPRNLNPELDIPIVFIQSALPGASPEDMELLVTQPIEDEVRSLDGIDTIVSASTEGLSAVTVQFLSDISRDDAETSVQTAVQSVHSLPNDATTPHVEALDFENDPIWTFTLSSDTDPATLNRFALTMKDSLEDLARIDTVTTRGDEKQEVQVLMKPDISNTLDVHPLALTNAIQNAVSSHPSGVVDSETLTFPLSIDPTVTTLDDLRLLNISLNGAVYQLGTIATIGERPDPTSSKAFLLTPDGKSRPSVTFEVRRISSERFDLAYQDAEDLIHNLLADQDDTFHVRTIYSLADEVSTQFTELFRNFGVTILLVFITLLLFFGARQAVIASLAIPMAFLIALIVMQLTGMSLNFLSLFSLLLSLGLLVDVTIVVISAVTAYWRVGRFSAPETIALVWRDYKVALLVTTLTTVWAFSPLLLASGIIGEFIRPIPIVVSSALLGSLFVGLFIALPLLAFLLKPTFPRRVRILGKILLALILAGVVFTLIGAPLGILAALISVVFILFAMSTYSPFRNRRKSEECDEKKKGILQYLSTGIISFSRISDAYRSLIRYILNTKVARRKTIAMVIFFFVFAMSLVPIGLVVNEFFPKADQNFFYIGIELPAGTKENVTLKEAFLITPTITKAMPEMRFVQLQTGVGITPEGAITNSPEKNTILFTVSLPAESDRNRSSIAIADGVRDALDEYQAGKVSVVELSGGPPAGADVQITFLGEDFNTLESFTNETITYLERQPGVTNVTLSVSSGSAKLVVTPDMHAFAKEGFSVADAGLLLRSFATGTELDTDVNFTDLEDTYDIMLRMSESTQSVESLGQLVAPSNQTGVSVYGYGTLALEPNPTKINHEDGKRALSVLASVEKGYSISSVNSALGNFADTLSLPTGYTWKTGGANEENNESVQSIIQAMGLAFVLILATLVIQLGSYRKALIVLLVIPLALSGVFIVFAITGTPLSFPALIGVLALFGIVVNNSIILVDKINLNLRARLPLLDAITDAAASRLEPIALGSLTTIIGLIPITLSDPIWQGLGGAIIAGLLFSGTIMLFFVPVIYFSWFSEEPTEINNSLDNTK